MSRERLIRAFAIGWVVGSATMLLATSVAAILDRLFR